MSLKKKKDSVRQNMAMPVVEMIIRLSCWEWRVGRERVRHADAAATPPTHGFRPSLSISRHATPVMKNCTVNTITVPRFWLEKPAIERMLEQ